MKSHWQLEPGFTFLNHGSFGACPTQVLEAQTEWRERLERQPLQFLVRDLPGLLDEARSVLANFIGVPCPEDIAFISNTTSGVNTILQSIAWAPSDELLTTNHDYGACRNALDYTAERTGARVVVAQVPFPIHHNEQIIDAVMACVTPRTRLAVLDHVTSSTAVVMPIQQLIEQLHARGVDTLIDGAHAPGMLEVDLKKLAPTYYVANCHKWLLAPKGAAFMYVRRDKQMAIRPTSISHGAKRDTTHRSRFLMEFDWTGTVDPTAYLCVPHAIQFIERIMPGGWDALRTHNHALACFAQRLLCKTLGVVAPVPESMLGSMASVALPPIPENQLTHEAFADPLQLALLKEHRMEVPVFVWPSMPSRLLRISAQIYNTAEEYRQLAEVLANGGNFCRIQR